MDKAFFAKRYEDLGWSLHEVHPLQALRINHLFIQPQQLVKRLEEKGVILEKIPYLQYGYFIKKSPFALTSTLEYLKGYFFLQDASSQKAAELLNPKSEDLVLDMCAAPGAKTTHLAQLMQNKGIIIALELKRERLISLKNNLERCRIKNSIVYHMDAKNTGKLNLQFDKILLDAPCSGNFVHEQGWFEKRDLEGIQRNAALQRNLLRVAISCLKQGGELVYSTCSLEPEENEENISWLQAHFPVKMLSFERIWPDKTTGFFMAKLRKTE